MRKIFNWKIFNWWRRPSVVMDVLDVQWVKAGGTALPAPYVAVEVSPTESTGTLRFKSTCLCRLDTGADLSSIPQECIDRLGQLQDCRPISARGIGGIQRKVPKRVRVAIMDKGQEWLSVIPEHGVLKITGSTGLIGLDVLNKVGMIWEPGGRKVSLHRVDQAGGGVCGRS